MAWHLGTAERHGNPSAFFSISPDDVHQTIAIRLSMPSKSNSGFPAFGGDDEDTNGR